MMNDGRRGGLSPVSVRHAGVNLPGSVRVQNQRVSAETVNGGGSGEEGGIAVSHAFPRQDQAAAVQLPALVEKRVHVDGNGPAVR